jgi:hypothetical protein
MKKTAALTLAATISIVVMVIASKADSAPKKEVDWNKLEPTMQNLLINMETPNVLMGNILTDGANNKSDCYEYTSTINSQRKLVSTWACWGKRENSFPKITTKWSETIPELNRSAKNIMPPSRGNILVDRKNRQYNCHLNNHVRNNEDKPVAQWTCWSILPFK